VAAQPDGDARIEGLEFVSRPRNKSPGRPPRNPGGTRPAATLTGRGLAWFSAKHPVLRFVAAFGLLAAMVYAAMLSSPFQRTVFPMYLRLTAQLASPVCNWFGQHTSATGTVISSDRFSIQIARGCDALEPLTLFAAMVLAFPAPFRRKIPGILLGTAILALVNLARIVSLFLTGVYFPDAFEPMHLEVWQSAFILLTIILWALWIQWAMKTRPAVAHAPR
jgi:exosortase H (IPTLxxWG-CTERM-specific)